MKIGKIASAFLLIGVGTFMHLSTGEIVSPVLAIVYWVAALSGLFILYANLKDVPGKVAVILWILGMFCGFLQGLEIICLYFIKLETLKGQYLEYNSIFGDWCDWSYLLLPLISYIYFLFYKPFFRLRAGWILLILISPLTLYLWKLIDLDFFVMKWRWVICFIAYSLLILQLFPARSKEWKNIFAFLWMFIGFVHSLNILLDNNTRSVLIAMVGTVVWLTGVFLFRSIGYKNRGTKAFIMYGILMLLSQLVHLLLFFLPSIVGDILAFILQLPAYIFACVGFARFAGSNAFHKTACGMRTLSGIMVIACLLAVIFLIPVVGKTIVSWVFVLLLLPLILFAWKNAFVACSVVSEETSEKAALSEEKATKTFPLQPEAVVSYAPLTEAERREEKLRKMTEDELRGMIRQRTRYSPDMREAAEKELQRRRR